MGHRPLGGQERGLHLAGEDVDAIPLTGGMAHLTEVVDPIRRRLAWIAPVTLHPGEDEPGALAAGALRVLRGEGPARPYPPG